MFESQVLSVIALERNEKILVFSTTLKDISLYMFFIGITITFDT